MSKETVFSNARIVLEDDVLAGSILIRDGKIADISEGNSVAGEDFEGDFIIPGLVELHTDHLEGHYQPRPGIRWNKTAAVQAHDAQIVTSGITTVFDCLRMGADEDGGFEHGEMREMADAIQSAEKEGRLRAEHLLHLRCEVSADNVLELFSDFE
ncbi:alpha-D-ribose 1-methylphosphonate 5-triphosphate diphosphatase, partial [Rhizobium phaseoli]